MKNKFITLAALFVATGLILLTVNIDSVSGQGSPRSPLDNHRVLMIGDSQVVGSFGVAMSYVLTAHGVTYYTRAGDSGSGVRQWLNSRSQIRRLIQRHDPTLFLIELGGNDHQRSARSDYAEEVGDLWRYVKDVMETNLRGQDANWRILWISPASVVEPALEIQPGRDRAAEKIRSVVTEENYVESRDITGEYGRTADGIHFTYEGGLDWARKVRPRIEEKLTDCL